MTTNEKILVTGATGRIGDAVLRRLSERGADPRAGARDPRRLDVPGTVEPVAVDLTKPETLRDALHGVRRVFLYAVPDGIDEFVAEAKEAGVEHVVVLSSQTVVDTIPERLPLKQMHEVVEDAVAESGIPYTFLRPENFASNLLMWGWPEMIRAESRVRFPYPDAHSDMIHELDIADVAVRVLTGSSYDGRALFLTGPESLTQRRQAEIIGAAIGRPVVFEEITERQARESLRQYIPDWVMDATVGYWAATDGVPAPLSKTVEEITGTPARGFAEWAADHAEDFR